MTTLADLHRGETARIVEVNAGVPVKQRLFDFGLRDGEEVTIVRSAPLSDPIELKLSGGYISLRKSEAIQVLVSRIK